MKGILEQISKANVIMYDPNLSMKEILDLASLLTENAPRSPFAIYTGVRGGFWIDWSITVMQPNYWRKHMTRSHSKLIKLLGHHEALAANGSIWLWEIHEGKIWWKEMYDGYHEEKIKRTMPTRFTHWESCLLMGEYEESHVRNHAAAVEYEIYRKKRNQDWDEMTISMYRGY